MSEVEEKGGERRGEDKKEGERVWKKRYERTYWAGQQEKRLHQRTFWPKQPLTRWQRTPPTTSPAGGRGKRRVYVWGRASGGPRRQRRAGGGGSVQ